jgi:anti-sigma regulatory factor (Ser/Thr protein kinase)
MGFSIIRAVVDDFVLEHLNEGGTLLTLTKRFDL